jgi:mevalonate kinase
MSDAYTMEDPHSVFETIFERDQADSSREGLDAMIRWRCYSSLAAAFNANHSLLQALTVSCPALDTLVDAARSAGALGAKLSGGGRGGNMIALVNAHDAHMRTGVFDTRRCSLDSCCGGQSHDHVDQNRRLSDHR